MLVTEYPSEKPQVLRRLLSVCLPGRAHSPPPPQTQRGVCRGVRRPARAWSVFGGAARPDFSAWRPRGKGRSAPGLIRPDTWPEVPGDRNRKVPPGLAVAASFPKRSGRCTPEQQVRRRGVPSSQTSPGPPLGLKAVFSRGLKTGSSSVAVFLLSGILLVPSQNFRLCLHCCVFVVTCGVLRLLEPSA